MCKKILTLLLISFLVLASIPLMADEQPVDYKETITVTEDGGRFQVGFVNIEFKKEFLDSGQLPATFYVKVSAKNGVAGIEISLDAPEFFKKVHLRVSSYQGLLYDENDETSCKNILVDIKKQQIIIGHFSRYAFS